MCMAESFLLKSEKEAVGGGFLLSGLGKAFCLCVLLAVLDGEGGARTGQVGAAGECAECCY